MDAKKLLYKYRQFGEAHCTAEITLKALMERHSRQGADENWWIRCNLPKNVLENGYLSEEDTQGKISYLEWVISVLAQISNAIDRAIGTLNKEQRALIEQRYFEGQTITFICDSFRIGDNKYHYLHRTALEAIQTVLNPLCIDDVVIDALLFAPMGQRLREAQRN